MPNSELHQKFPHFHKMHEFSPSTPKPDSMGKTPSSGDDQPRLDIPLIPAEHSSLLGERQSSTELNAYVAGPIQIPKEQLPAWQQAANEQKDVVIAVLSPDKDGFVYPQSIGFFQNNTRVWEDSTFREITRIFLQEGHTVIQPTLLESPTVRSFGEGVAPKSFTVG